MNFSQLEVAHSILADLASEKGLHWAQIGAHRSFIRAIGNGHRRIYADMAMGSGKTAIELTYMEACYRAGLDIRAGIMTNGADDVNNIIEREAPIWAPELAKSGMLRRFVPSEADVATPYFVSTYTGGMLGIRKGVLAKPDLIFADEAQMSLSKIRQGLFSGLGLDTLIIGLTATPAYRATKSLNSAGYYESYRLPFETAVAHSLLSSYRNILLGVEDPFVSLDGIDITQGDYDQNQLERIMRHHSVMDAVIDYFTNWEDPVTGQSLFDRKGMFSCCSIPHAIFVAETMNKAFQHLMPEGIQFCEPIWSDSKYAHRKSSVERADIVDRHRSRKTLFLATKDLLLTGHDDKKIDTIVNLRPTSSLVLAPQRGGRAVRFDPQNPDKEAHIIDVILNGRRGTQKIFADYAGGAFIETIEKQERRKILQPTEGKSPGGSRKADDLKSVIIPKYKLYYKPEEIRSFIVTRERREAIAKRPWLAQVIPPVMDILIKQDIGTFGELIQKVRNLSAIHGWDDDITKSKGKRGTLSATAIYKALIGSMAHDREEENTRHFREISKKISALQRRAERAQEEEKHDAVEVYKKEMEALDKELRKPVIDTYSFTEVAVGMALGVHPSKLFGRIPIPVDTYSKFETHPDPVTGNKIILIPEGVSNLRSRPLGHTVYEPDHLFPADEIATMMEGRDPSIQLELMGRFSDAVSEEFEELLGEDPDAEYDLSPESRAQILDSIMEEILGSDDPKDEGILRRSYQRMERKNSEDLSLPGVSVFSEEFESAAIIHGHSQTPNIDAVENHNELREQIKIILGSLTPREELVLRLRFGILSGEQYDEDHTLEEVGNRINVTRERVRQIEAKAIRKIMHPSRSRSLAEFDRCPKQVDTSKLKNKDWSNKLDI